MRASLLIAFLSLVFGVGGCEKNKAEAEPAKEPPSAAADTEESEESAAVGEPADSEENADDEEDDQDGW